MQAFRVSKPKPPRSSKPPVPWQQRQNEIADFLESAKIEAMVACTECANNGEACFYLREHSVKCAACLRHRRECDGTFSVEELRKVGEQKKQLSAKSRAKRREITRLRKTLTEARRSLAALESEMAEVEEEDISLQDSLARLDEVSNNMLKREMMALGAFDRVPVEQEVALAEPDFVMQGAPVTDSIDWSVVWNFGEDGQAESSVSAL